MAPHLRDILNHLLELPGCVGERMAPPLERTASYNVHIADPQDLTAVEAAVKGGQYNSWSQFDHDLRLVFQNAIRFFGRSLAAGRAAHALRTAYVSTVSSRLAADSSFRELVGPVTSAAVGELARPVAAATAVAGQQDNGEDSKDDIISCPCDQYRDEGVMVQCESCGVWQHTDCVLGPDQDPASVERFLCDPCAGRRPNWNIALVPQPEYASPGETYFVSLEREDGLHVTLGTTVYVLRAFKDTQNSLEEGSLSKQQRSTTVLSENAEEEESKIVTGPGGVPHKSISPIKGPSREAAALAPGNYPTYKTVHAASVSSDDMDIFRVERLWRSEAGRLFAFGYHYLRPHETFHEPTRRFFPNEVFRVPVYEVLPLDTLWRQCWVLDPVTFCRGRPLAAEEEHVYICEYRVDKSARLFSKISKGKHQICTKPYAFHNFDIRLKISRTYTVGGKCFVCLLSTF